MPLGRRDHTGPAGWRSQAGRCHVAPSRVPLGTETDRDVLCPLLAALDGAMSEAMVVLDHVHLTKDGSTIDGRSHMIDRVPDRFLFVLGCRHLLHVERVFVSLVMLPPVATRRSPSEQAGAGSAGTSRSRLPDPPGDLDSDVWLVALANRGTPRLWAGDDAPCSGGPDPGRQPDP